MKTLIVLIIALVSVTALALYEQNTATIDGAQAGVVRTFENVPDPIQGNDRVIQGSSPKLQGNSSALQGSSPKLQGR